MIDIVKQVIDYYTKYLKQPNIDDLNIKDMSLLERSGNVFVTVFLNGEIRGSAGNIKQIEKSIAFELINNTIQAISKDSRFKPLTMNEAKDIKIRVDEITNQKVLKKGEIEKLEPLKSGVIAIEKQYDKLAVILPNISNKLVIGRDLALYLDSKVGGGFEDDKYIVYSIETESVKDY